MDEELYIAVVKCHHQPPIETPAEIRTHTKVFGRDATVADVWEWALSLIGKSGYTTITSFEFRPNE